MLFLEWWAWFVSWLDLVKRRTLFKAFVESQFKYCLIVWMFHSRRTNNKINRLHERAPRIVYDDNVSTSDQLLAIDESFCIHHQNTQWVLIEIYKALHDISGNSLKELFVKMEIIISLRSKPELVISSVNSSLKGDAMHVNTKSHTFLFSHIYIFWWRYCRIRLKGLLLGMTLLMKIKLILESFDFVTGCVVMVH